jgi:pimeloyl-ACP methyl ester carboxylesterase
MADFGMPALAAADLARIAVPTTLIWGRRDLQVPLSVAETANARFGGRCTSSRAPATTAPWSNPRHS